MTLVLKRRLNTHDKQVLVALPIVGLVILLGVSLTQTAAVQSPSHGVAGGSFGRVDDLLGAAAITTHAAKRNSSAASAKRPVQPPICQSAHPIRYGLSDAASPQLQKLAQYEQLCNSGVVEKLSFFIPTPTTPTEAREYARDTSAQLYEFANYKISPVVFFEPTTASGLVDMQKYGAGHYDAVLDLYFAAIKAAGVTDAMMGIWVPLPEGNLPVWSSVNPDDFAACVIRAITYQKKYFPNSSASVMLDTDTYPVSGSWTDGRAASLLPYIKNIPDGMIDSIGLQGMPWSAPANADKMTNGAPGQYLRTDLVAEAARTLGTKNIWLNTGSFSVKYANQPDRQITVSPDRRQAQLNGVLAGVKSLQSQNFAVAVHLFAEDKSNVPEATDWSYWSDEKAASSPSTVVFATFVRDLQAANVPLWLYDSK